MKSTHLQFIKWVPVFMLLLLSNGRLRAQFVEYYDIYVYNLKTSTLRQVTSIPNQGEFNCSWSPDSKTIAAESVDPLTWQQDIYVTDVASGVSTLLKGGNGGNDAAWSPDGTKIMFDKTTDDWYSGIFSVPAQGGDPALLRDHGVNAAWSNNSQHIVFLDEDSWWLKTLNLINHTENSLLFGGENPVWSPDGQYIAYDEWYCCGGIWVIKVNESGEPLGDPVQLTNFGYQPSWSNNSKTIIFSGSLTSDADDIYSVQVSGGTVQRVCGRDDAPFGDYDPCFSNNGQYIAFSSATLPSKSIIAAAPADEPSANGLQAAVLGNPGSNSFRLDIKSKSAETLSVRVTDMKGQTVFNQTGIQPNAILNIGDNFSCGVYITEIRQGAQVKMMKLIKQ